MNLLDECGLLCGIKKYSESEQHIRSSSPKLQVYNNALLAACLNKDFKTAISNPEFWGRFVESCVGAHILNKSVSCSYKINYWRNGNNEVDFVISNANEICAIEVKSGSRSSNLGMKFFKEKYPSAKVYVVSSKDFSNAGCLLLQDFLNLSPNELF